MTSRTTDPRARPPWPRATVGRADLLRLLDRLPAGLETSIGELTGFDWHPPAPPPPPEPPAPVSLRTPPAAAPNLASPLVQGERPPLRAPMWAITEVEELAPPEPAADTHTDAFDPEGTVFERELVGDPSAAQPARCMLSPARRLGVFLRREGRQPYRRADLDTPALVRCLTHGDWPAHLPRLSGWRWGPEVAVVIDAPDAVFPWVSDFEALVEAVSLLSGRRTPVYWRNPHRGWFRHDPSRPDTPWRPVSADGLRQAAHWLLVGDLGVFSAAAGRSSHWWRLIQAQQRRGGTVSALLPSGRGATAVGLPRSVTVYRWDHGRALVAERAAGVGRRGVVASPGLAGQTRRLLRACAMAVVVEPDLLRALRLALGLPVETEVEVWRHTGVDRCTLGLQIKPPQLAALRIELKAEVPLAQRDRLAELIRQHHGRQSPLIQMEEAALAADLAGPQQLASAREVWQTAARTLMRAPDSAVSRAIARYVRRTAGRAHPALWAGVPDLARTWVEASVWQILDGEAIPPGVPGEIVQEVLDRLVHGDGRPDLLCLVQRGPGIWLQRQPPGRGQSLLGQIQPAPGVLVLDPDGGLQGWFTPGDEPVRLCTVRAPGVWRIQTARQRLTLAPVPRPAGLEGWYRDRFGLAVDWERRWPPAQAVRLTPPGPTGRLAAWRVVAPPETGAVKAVTGWMSSFVRRLVGRGTATSPLQVDAFGMALSLTIQGVVQGFRYVPAGSFWMGSSDTEPGHDSACEGPRHRVTLTEGFWLADTACTQALWQAVMGSNPSYFQGDPELPVDSVRWDDVQKFLARLQRLLPDGCEAVLPTEAQWEYSCRAGTHTAFSVGTDLLPEQANFNFGGNIGKTVVVKTYAPNPWGLYQMHGNVWEWCEGSRRKYEAKSVEDPLDGQDRGDCALRGGSWLLPAEGARSASRFEFHRDRRHRSSGFRFALRLIKPG